MPVHVALRPFREGAAVGERLHVVRVDLGKRFVAVRLEVRRDAPELLFGDDRGRVLHRLPLGFDLAREFLDAERLHQDLDARLVDVVAAPVAVVHAQDRLAVGEHLLPRQELADHVADDRRAAHAAAGDHADADFARGVADHVQADVVQQHRGAVGLGAVQRDLELARQPRELRMERGPLPQDLRERARINDLVGRHAREMVGGDVANAVARRLDRVHLH